MSIKGLTANQYDKQSDNFYRAYISAQGLERWLCKTPVQMLKDTLIAEVRYAAVIMRLVFRTFRSGLIIITVYKRVP